MSFNYDSYRIDNQPEYTALRHRGDVSCEIPIRPKGFEATVNKFTGEASKDEGDFRIWLDQVMLYRESLKKYKKYQDEVMKIQAMCEARFKQDLFKELGIEKNPKRETLYQKAFEKGHSAGYAEVAAYARELVELIE